METKKCPICGIDKNINDYYSYFSTSRNKYRISNYCKDCAKIKGCQRAKKHYKDNKEQKKQYAKDYRANPKNKEKLQTVSRMFKIKYRENLQDCYVRDILTQKDHIPNYVSKSYPEIVETKRLQIKIKRKIKSLKNNDYGKK